MYFIAGAAFLLGGAVFFGLRRAFERSKPIGTPTPYEAKVQEKVSARAGKLVEKNKLKLQEIAHASDDELLARVRDSLRDDKAD